jgi:hypothetical protein
MPEDTWIHMVESLHVEFGTLVASRWNLPQALCEAIRFHPQPRHASEPHRALVSLVAGVDAIIAVLDRGPHDDHAALDGVANLSVVERDRICELMPKFSAQMAAVDCSASKDTGRATVDRTTVVCDAAWPVDFVVRARDATEYRANALGPNVFSFMSRTPFQTAWIAEVTLVAEPETIKMLANVRTCEPLAKDQYLVTLQPFGLGGDDKAAWLRLVNRTRRVAQMM